MRVWVLITAENHLIFSRYFFYMCTSTILYCLGKATVVSRFANLDTTLAYNNVGYSLAVGCGTQLLRISGSPVL